MSSTKVDISASKLLRIADLHKIFLLYPGPVPMREICARVGEPFSDCVPIFSVSNGKILLRAMMAHCHVGQLVQLCEVCGEAPGNTKCGGFRPIPEM